MKAMRYASSVFVTSDIFKKRYAELGLLTERLAGPGSTGLPNEYMDLYDVDEVMKFE